MSDKQRRLYLLDMSARAAEAPEGERSRVFDIVWTTGAPVQRMDWFSGERFQEVLEVSDAAIDMTRLNSGAPVLLDHDGSVRSQVGVVEKAWLDSSGLAPVGRATVRLSARQDVDGLVTDIADGIIRNVSVGYRVHTWKKSKEGKEQVRLATRWEPIELSIVAAGADPGAGFNRSESPDDGGIEEVNMDIKEQTRSAVETEAPVMTAPEQRSAASVDLKTALAEERARVSEISALCRTFGHESQLDGFVASGVSVDQVRKAIMDSMAKQTHQNKPGVAMPGEQDERSTGVKALSDALYLRASGKEPEQGANEMTVRFRNASLLQIAAKCLSYAGFRHLDSMSSGELMVRALESTSDFPKLLGSNMNRILLDAYALAPQTWAPLAEEYPVADFRQIEMLRLGSTGTPVRLVEGGEIQFGGLEDATRERTNVLRYAKGEKITFELLVNDDLNGIRRLLNSQGEAMQRLQSNLAWEQITSNPTMGDGVALFHAASHGNLDGSGAVISNASLGAMRLAMRKQTEPNGYDYLNLAPTHLIIPPELETGVNQLLQNAFQPVQSSTTVEAVWRSMPVIVEGRLSAASTTAWYGASVGANKPLARVTLIGERTPVTQQEIEFGTGNVKLAIRFAVGFKVLDWRTLYKNVGA